MKAKPDRKTVGELVELFKASMLKANPEYQRGVVWSSPQKKKLIDSVLRGYPLPMIYLHHIKTSVAGMQREDLEIIDGQQRITALYEFAEGAFKLFDPIADEKVAKFPNFIKRQPCPWAGRDVHGLNDEDRKRLLGTPLSLSVITTDDNNEVRDLFVRLQSGLPLNGQETRDAWPGRFTDFILRLGGKPQMAKYQGHDFFTKTLGMSPDRDRGKTRQLAAQIAILYLARRASAETYSDINSAAIDDFYYSNLDFEADTPEAKRFVAILDKLADIIRPGKHGRLKGHDAIHLVLLVDTLWDDYVRSWEASLPKALDEFLANLAKAKLGKDNAVQDPYWQYYGQWTRVNSDRGERIAHRHKFYVEKMFEFMQPLTPKDPTRLYGELERTILFYRQQKQCAVCEVDVDWREAEVHHVKEHSKGGATDLDNGALVHKKCHPKSEAATQALAAKLARRKKAYQASEVTLEDLDLDL